MWYNRFTLNIWWSLNILRDTGRFGRLSLTPCSRAGIRERLWIRSHQRCMLLREARCMRSCTECLFKNITCKRRIQHNEGSEDGGCDMETSRSR